MFDVLLIIFFSLDFCISNNPLLLASPYPFNTSQSSHLECFSNDQGIILSLTITATMFDTEKNNPSFQSINNEISKNGSVILIIPASFNYSQLYSQIECRSKYHHGVQKTTHLDVLSVVEIPQKELFSINTHTKQVVAIHCLTYGTNTYIHWSFSKDISKDRSGSLPIGTRLDHQYTRNDTLIIDHVSYSDHHGYYQCHATNQLLGIIYEDHSRIYLNVQSNTFWISIVIVCVVIGICILIITLYSKYCQKRIPNQLEDKEMTENKTDVISNEEELTEYSSDMNKERSSKQMVENVKELKIQQEHIQSLFHSENSVKLSSSFVSGKTSPRFLLGNPFLDPNVRTISQLK